MSSRTGLRLATAGALAITLVLLPAFGSAARDRSAATTEFSAAKDKDKDQQKNKNAGQRGQQQKQQFKGDRGGGQKQGGQKIGGQGNQQGSQKIGKSQGSQKIGKSQPGSQKIGKSQGSQKIGKSQQGSQKIGNVQKVRVFTPKGANAKIVTSVKLRGIPRSGAGRFAIRGHNYSAWRGGYRVRHGNNWRTFVALSTLGVLAIGAANYYPYAYIEAPEPFCEGLTEDGCQLNWDEVETVEGDIVGQCVAYCPWQ